MVWVGMGMGIYLLVLAAVIVDCFIFVCLILFFDTTEPRPKGSTSLLACLEGDLSKPFARMHPYSKAQQTRVVPFALLLGGCTRFIYLF